MTPGTSRDSGLLIQDIDWAETYAQWPKGPPLKDVFGTADARKAAIQFHLKDRAEGCLKLGVGALVRFLPPQWASDLTGPRLAPLVTRQFEGGGRWRRMSGLVKRWRPDLGPDDAARDAMLHRWHITIGRGYGEFLAAETILRTDGAITVTGDEHLAAARASGRSVIVPTVHTGPWEILANLSITQHFGGAGTGPWQPQKNRFQNHMVAAVRRRQGYRGLSPSPHLARRLRAVLNVPGQMVLVLIDEQSEGQNKFPLFGRPIPSRCNFSFTLRAADASGALILPYTGWRTADGPKFAMKYHPPIDMAALPGDRSARIAAGAEALNAIFEPHVIAHLDEWYMLHSIRV